MKEKLQCKPFDWFMNNVWPDLLMYEENTRAWGWVSDRATENRFFAGPDRFLVFKTDSVCIKRFFFGPKKHTLLIIYWPNYLV